MVVEVGEFAKLFINDLLHSLRHNKVLNSLTKFFNNCIFVIFLRNGKNLFWIMQTEHIMCMSLQQNFNRTDLIWCTRIHHHHIYLWISLKRGKHPLPNPREQAYTCTESQSLRGRRMLRTIIMHCTVHVQCTCTRRFYTWCTDKTNLLFHLKSKFSLDDL